MQDLDPAAREELKRLLPEITRGIEELHKDEWYPLGRLVEVCTTIDQVYGDAERGFAAIKGCGRYIAEEGASTYLKLVLKIVTPRLFVRQFPTLWKRYHDFGELTIDTGGLDQNRATIFMPAYPCVRGLSTGWIEYAFTLFKTQVRIESNWPWRAPVPDRLELRLHWD